MAAAIEFDADLVDGANRQVKPTLARRCGTKKVAAECCPATPNLVSS
jgi:hypothetical protein